jgi:hypothetical protein
MARVPKEKGRGLRAKERERDARAAEPHQACACMRVHSCAAGRGKSGQDAEQGAPPRASRSDSHQV